MNQKEKNLISLVIIIKKIFFSTIFISLAEKLKYQRKIRIIEQLSPIMQ